VSNIEKVDSVTLLRKDKVMAGISWAVKFQRAVDTCFNNLRGSAAQVLRSDLLLSDLDFLQLTQCTF
jgi:hypothetical protein